MIFRKDHSSVLNICAVQFARFPIYGSLGRANCGGDMSFLETYGKEVVSLLVPVVSWVIGTYFRARARILVSAPHKFTFLVTEPLRNEKGDVVAPTQVVHTISYMLSNSGRETATKVEFVFNWKPLCVNFWPTRHFTAYEENDKRYVVVFDSLSPGEILGCELLAVNQNLPDLTLVRSDQCLARWVPMEPQPLVKAWQRRLGVFLVVLGAAALIYWGIILLQFLILKTPF